MENHKNRTMPFFLTIEDAKDSHHDHYLMRPQTVNEVCEAAELIEPRLSDTVSAVYIHQAYCPECWDVGHYIECNHELEPAAHLDFVWCRIRHYLYEDWHAPDAVDNPMIVNP